MRRPLIAVGVGAIVAVVGVALGAWWAPFVVGMALGVTIDRARWAILAGAACGLLAWLLPLAVEQVRYGVGPTANALAAIMGFNPQGAIPLTLALLVGLLLGLCGAWLASVARPLIPREWLLLINR